MAYLDYNSLTLRGGEGEKGKDLKDEMYSRKTKGEERFCLLVLSYVDAMM